MTGSACLPSGPGFPGHAAPSDLASQWQSGGVAWLCHQWVADQLEAAALAAELAGGAVPPELLLALLDVDVLRPVLAAGLLHAAVAVVLPHLLGADDLPVDGVAVHRHAAALLAGGAAVLGGVALAVAFHS